MAYVKNTWVDQDVERPKTYEVTNNQDGTITLTDSFGLVEELGTPVNATNMNHIEEGIDGCAIRKHNLTETFNKGEWVAGSVNNKNGIYESVIPNNVGNPLTDINSWQLISLGGGYELNDFIWRPLPTEDANKHLADGALIDGSGSSGAYVNKMANIYDNLSPIGYRANATIIGSLTDNNGLLSNFNDSNYAMLPQAFSPASNPWEIVLKFTYINSNTNQIILDINNGTLQTRPLSIYISGTTGTVAYCASTFVSTETGSGNQHDIINDAAGSNVLTNGTTYYVKFEFTGSAYNGYISTDGQTWTPDITVANSNVIASGYSGYFGKWITAGIYSRGSIDLNGSYININNQQWWNGVRAVKSGFCTEAEWQASVSTYGVCGKFVYDSINNTVRLPKVTGIMEGTIDANALGDLVEAGLPDHNHITNAFLWVDNGWSEEGARVPNYGLNLNLSSTYASASNPIYGRSNTVQPQTLKGYIYIVIANSTKTEIEVDIDEIATDLNGKADVDLTNVNDAGNIKMARASMPSNKYRNLTLNASGATYIAPADGYFTIRADGVAPDTSARFVNQTSGGICSGWTTGNGGQASVHAFIPALKGQTILLEYASLTTVHWFRFVYAVGSESEAQ